MQHDCGGGGGAARRAASRGPLHLQLSVGRVQQGSPPHGKPGCGRWWSEGRSKPLSRAPIAAPRCSGVHRGGTATGTSGAGGVQAGYGRPTKQSRNPERPRSWCSTRRSGGHPRVRDALRPRGHKSGSRPLRIQTLTRSVASQSGARGHAQRRKLALPGPARDKTSILGPAAPRRRVPYAAHWRAYRGAVVERARGAQASPGAVRHAPRSGLSPQLAGCGAER